MEEPWQQLAKARWDFMRMRSKFGEKIAVTTYFRNDIRKWVEQSRTAAYYSLRIWVVNIRFLFALAGSMNRASE